MLAARQSDLRPDPKAGSADILAPLVFDLALGGALFAGLVALVLVADRTPQTRSRRESGDRDGLLGDLDASEARESRRRGAEDRPAGRQLGPWKGALHWFRVRDRVPNGRGILNSMWKLSIADVGKVAGRDAEVVLTFHLLSFLLFLLLSLLAIPILAPLHVTAQPAKSWLSALSITNLPAGSSRLGVHLAVAWIVCLFVMIVIGTTWGWVVLGGGGEQVVRSESFETLVADQEEGDAAVLCLAIPSQLRSEDALRGFLERTAPGVEIGCVEFVPDTRELQDVVQKRMDVVEQLETALGEVERRGVDLVAVRRWLEGSNENAPSNIPINLQLHLLHLHSSINELTGRIEHLRETLPTTSSAAILALSNPSLATLLCRTFPSVPSTFGDALSYLIRPRFRIIPAPNTRDLAWSRLGKRRRFVIAIIRTTLVWTAIFAIAVFWTIPVGFIIGLLSLENLEKLFPGLGPWIERLGPGAKGLVQGLVPVLVTSIWQAVLPIIFTALLSLLPSPLLSSLPALPISLLRAFHVYLLINLLLVVPLSSGLFSTLTTIFTEPASIPTLLGQSLVDTGGFFADYVALQGIVGVVSSALLRNVDWLGLIAGIWGWGKWSDRRKEGYLDNVGYVDVGSEMVVPLLAFAIGILYFQIQPIVAPFCALYFLLSYIGYKFTYLVWHRPPNGMTGSGMVREGLVAALGGRCFFAMVIWLLTLLGILTTKQLFISAPLVLTPLIILLIIFWTRCEKVWDDAGIHVGQDTSEPAQIRGVRKGKRPERCDRWKSPAVWGELEEVRWLDRFGPAAD